MADLKRGNDAPQPARMKSKNRRSKNVGTDSQNARAGRIQSLINLSPLPHPRCIISVLGIGSEPEVATKRNNGGHAQEGLGGARWRRARRDSSWPSGSRVGRIISSNADLAGDRVALARSHWTGGQYVPRALQVVAPSQVKPISTQRWADVGLLAPTRAQDRVELVNGSAGTRPRRPPLAAPALVVIIARRPPRRPASSADSVCGRRLQPARRRPLRRLPDERAPHASQPACHLWLDRVCPRGAPCVQGGAAARDALPRAVVPHCGVQPARSQGPALAGPRQHLQPRRLPPLLHLEIPARVPVPGAAPPPPPPIRAPGRPEPPARAVCRRASVGCAAAATWAASSPPGAA